MKLRIPIIVVLMLVCVVGVGRTGPVMSQEQNPAVRPAKPEEIPFTYDATVFDKIEIEQVSKTVVEKDAVPADTPAHSCFHLQDKRPLPALDRGPRYFYPAYSSICLIPLTDPSEKNFAKSYPTINASASQLRKLLVKRPPKFRFYKDLTDLPYNNSSGAILSRVEYLPFKSGKGILYLTQYSQDMLPSPVNNEELTCVFQGLSDDGKYYVAARFAITHPSLPKGIDFTKDIETDKGRKYLRKAEQSLNSFSEESFSPSLKTLKSLISSISTKS